MDAPSPDETIVAVSTPAGSGGIGVVRLSGDAALQIVGRFFRPRRALRKIPPRRAIFGHLHEPGRNEPFDEAILTYFRAPFSYTREDVVEVSCHGSPAVLEEVVRLAVRHGARLAHPGEFTRRAYLRGRIDILQAEAVNDLVRATSFEHARYAYRTVEGRLSKQIASLRNGAIRLLSEIEAAIEFPEENLRTTPARISAAMAKIGGVLERLIGTYETGRTIAHGATVAILGRTNVGKSTLFNALLEEPRAIVTPHPGTTRDYLREKMQIGGAVFNLIDMAGLGRPTSGIEKEGMRRGRRLASQADGILFVLDGTKADLGEDLALIRKYKKKNKIFIINKIDKIRGTLSPVRRERLPGPVVVEVSALRGTNIDKLRAQIYESFGPKLGPKEDVIFHLRDKLLLEEALGHLRRGLRRLKDGHPEEVWAEEIRGMISSIGRMTGEIRADDVLESIFSRFCVGK
jgi:tRNA modification GTPase